MKETKLLNFFESSKFLVILSFLGLYLFSSGVSWIAFSIFGKSSTSLLTDNQKSSGGSSRSRINLNLPKTEMCPINGKMFTKPEREIWEKRRPILAMIENHADSRPQSGLSRADIVYEAVAEGGITRFMGVFYCGVSAEDVKIAPVRSARIYFVNWAAEYGKNPIYVHVGGANNYCNDPSNCPRGQKIPGQVAREVRAVELLESLGWRVPKGNDFDTIYDSGYPVFWRDPERLKKPVAAEHTMVASIDKIFEQAEKRGFGATGKEGDLWNKGYTHWLFADDSPSQTPTASNISFEFWSNKPDYNVEWKYDKATNSYLRFNGGNLHTDLEFDNEQLSAKNVVIQFVKEKGPVDKEGHMFYTTVGTGEMLVFRNGEIVEGTWSKQSINSKTKFVDSKGKEISFVKGSIWIEAVPVGNEIKYN